MYPQEGFLLAYQAALFDIPGGFENHENDK
jgi:hypothetical protein